MSHILKVCNMFQPFGHYLVLHIYSKFSSFNILVIAYTGMCFVLAVIYVLMTYVYAYKF
jgi:hypothetical protein